MIQYELQKAMAAEFLRQADNERLVRKVRRARQEARHAPRVVTGFGRTR